MTDVEIILEHWQQRVPQHLLDATRIFHGRGHCYPGLEHVCIDYFSPILLIILYQDPGELWLQQLVQAFLAHNHHQAISAIVVQRRYQTPVVIENYWGTLPEQPCARERGLTYALHFHTQNVGFFTDMTYGRSWCAEHTSGWHVLNLFAYTCAFSVVALKQGAQSVVNIDMHAPFLHMGRENHKRNGVYDTQRVHFLAHDVFKSWGKLRRYGPYDLIICDPPPQQHKHFVADKDYLRVVRHLPSLIKPQGYILACLNSPYLGYNDLEHFFTATDTNWQPLCCFLLPSDFPEQNPHRGLKMMLLQWTPPSSPKTAIL